MFHPFRAASAQPARCAAPSHLAASQEWVTSGGLGPTLRRQVDPRQRTPLAARVASGSGQEETSRAPTHLCMQVQCHFHTTSIALGFPVSGGSADTSADTAAGFRIGLAKPATSRGGTLRSSTTTRRVNTIASRFHAIGRQFTFDDIDLDLRRTSMNQLHGFAATTMVYATNRLHGFATTTMMDATNGPARLRVFTAGDGPTVVMLAHIGGGPPELEPLAQRLVAAGLRVVLPEPRGYGESVGPLEGVTLRDLAADVAQAIETVGGAPVVVAGHTSTALHACWLRIARTSSGG
jgi:hypothetical protein